LKARTVLALACLLPLASTVTARASTPGTLDKTFSGDGVASNSLLSNFSNTFVQVDSADRVLVGGFNANLGKGLVVRYEADGTLDSTWGKRYMPNSSGGLAGLALVGTKTMVGIDDGPYFGLVARLNANGSLDKTFGTAGEVDFGMPLVDIGVDPSGDTFALANDGSGHSALFKVSPNGKAVTETTLCVGVKYYASQCGSPDAITVSPRYVYVGGSAPVGLIADGTNSALVGRFLLTGTLDKGYGQKGYAWFDPQAGIHQDYSNATAVAVSPKTGQVWAVGQSCFDFCPHDGPNFYARFSAAGFLDFYGEADFGDCGGSCFASSAHPTGVALQGGKAVIVGLDDGDNCTSSSGHCFGVERVTATGVPDTTFAGTGMVLTTKAPVGASDVRILDTKIVVAGGQYVARFQG
jgi:uncharacterized delta-60 repeat protein